MNRTAGLVLALALPFGVACSPPPPAGEPAALETEEVSLPPDALVDVSVDAQEAARSDSGISGQLPSDFPPGVPLPTGSSLVDVGEEGERWVELLVPRARAGFEPAYRGRLQAVGWQPGATDAEGSTSYRREGETIEVRVAADGPSSRLQIRY